MLINRKELEQISELAKLTIDEKEIQQISESLTSIMNMIDQIKIVNTDNVKPMANPLDAVQRLRIDEVTESSKKQQLLELANNADKDFYLVPKVID